MSTATLPPITPLTKKDFQTDQEVRWCPGCGDYAVLKAVQRTMPELGVARARAHRPPEVGLAQREQAGT